MCLKVVQLRTRCVALLALGGGQASRRRRRRRSRVECCSDLRKCNARVEERRLIARNDRGLYLELVVAVAILLSPLVIIKYNKQKSCFFVPTILLVPDNTCV